MMSIRNVLAGAAFAAAVLVCTTAVAQEADAGPSAADAAPAAAPAARVTPDCLRFRRDDDSEDDSDSASRIAPTTFGIGDQVVVLAEVRFVGLVRLSEAQVWSLVGGRPAGPLDLEQAQVLVARLAESGLFSRVKPAVWLGQGDAPAALEINVVEQPRIERVEVTGLVELTPGEILDSFFSLPDAEDEDARPTCPEPNPPRGWLARSERGLVRPGFVWRGVDHGLERVQEQLDDDGYTLSQVTATLDASGVLRITVDEGRLDAVELAGVHPAIRDEVRRLLGVKAGGVFNRDDLELGLEAVRERYPFLDTHEIERPALSSRRLVQNPLPDGGVGYLFVEGPPRCQPHVEGLRIRNVDVKIIDDSDPERRVERLVEAPEAEPEACPQRHEWFQIDGRKLTVHLEANRFGFDADWLELLRHTQVTNWAPGLLIRLHAWDPGDRVHFGFDTLFNLNYERDSRETPGEDEGSLAELSANERVDLQVAPSLSIPGIGLAELGGAVYTLTDSDDGWRVTDLDSYLNSILGGGSFREFYRRTGVSGFATFHVFEQLTLGAEYRYDRYDSLARLDDVDTIFGEDPELLNPAITDGTFGSLLFRLEWSSDDVPLSKLRTGGGRRGAQGTMIDHPVGRAGSGLRTANTFELADPALGGDFAFWRLVSDNVLSLETGEDQGVFLRLRVGAGDDLPLQRQEALGGWGSLRGHGFKELRGGDASILGSLEYRFDALGLFVDVGALHAIEEDEWQGPKIGVGAALLLGDSAQFALAWRTDEDAEATPELRLIFGRPW